MCLPLYKAGINGCIKFKQRIIDGEELGLLILIFIFISIYNILIEYMVYPKNEVVPNLVKHFFLKW